MCLTTIPAAAVQVEQTITAVLPALTAQRPLLSARDQQGQLPHGPLDQQQQEKQPQEQHWQQHAHHHHNQQQQQQQRQHKYGRVANISEGLQQQLLLDIGAVLSQNDKKVSLEAAAAANIDRADAARPFRVPQEVRLHHTSSSHGMGKGRHPCRPSGSGTAAAAPAPAATATGVPVMAAAAAAAAAVDVAAGAAAMMPSVPAGPSDWRIHTELTAAAAAAAASADPNDSAAGLPDVVRPADDESALPGSSSGGSSKKRRCLDQHHSRADDDDPRATSSTAPRKDITGLCGEAWILAHLTKQLQHQKQHRLSADLAAAVASSFCRSRNSRVAAGLPPLQAEYPYDFVIKEPQDVAQVVAAAAAAVQAASCSTDATAAGVGAESPLSKAASLITEQQQQQQQICNAVRELRRRLGAPSPDRGLLKLEVKATSGEQQIGQQQQQQQQQQQSEKQTSCLSECLLHGADPFQSRFCNCIFDFAMGCCCHCFWCSCCCRSCCCCHRGWIEDDVGANDITLTDREWLDAADTAHAGGRYVVVRLAAVRGSCSSAHIAAWLPDPPQLFVQRRLNVRGGSGGVQILHHFEMCPRRTS
jgi:hypothetical protein